ncbi:MAG: glycosyltransferase, partial [Acidimicrobiales bacterium]
HDPGPWFDETLRSLSRQDYPELSVLVLDAASAEDPTPRVAAVLPNAFVRRLASNPGFGPAADEVLEMVQGASHLLLCHDDVALDPDVVHILVEESFRSNAAIVAPKFVSWDDPSRLLHVGMAVDKGGAVVDRVEPGEVDQGQHDAVRDVFLAPGGCTLVRADLFAEIGGFDPQVSALGEDLDLCWRAQVAGARVVVAPAARVRHLERTASGQRPLPGAALAELPGVEGTRGLRRRDRRLWLQALQRRHELHAVLCAYGPLHLLRVLPQLVVLAMAETTIALLTGNRDRAVAVVHAWRWNWRHRSDIRVARGRVRAHRRLSDTEVRRLQLRGSARLTAFVRRAVTHGLQVAHIGGVAEEQALDAVEEGAETGRRPLGVPGRLIAWAVIAVLLLIGSRQLLGLGLPDVAGLLPLPGAGELLHRFLAGWQPTGVGTTDPTSPATGALGILVVLLGGSSGLAQKVVVLGCIPVGAIGMARLVRPFGSWARVVATAVYVALPVAYDALALGRWDALVIYAATPWLLARLARASDVAPFAVPLPPQAAPAWRATFGGQVLAFGLLEAAACSLAPDAGAVTLLVSVSLALGVILMAGRAGTRAAGRVLALGSLGTAVAVVLLAPWSIALLGGPERWAVLTGVPLASGSAPDFAQLLRLAVGPIGDSALAYGLLAAALLPLLIGARRRLTWAGQVWTVSLACIAVAWASERGWLGAFAVPPQALLVPAAATVALSVGLGVAAFERDLPAHRFGWRQMASVLAAVAAVVGALPVLGAVGGGRWDLPPSGYGEATAWMATRTPHGGFRVLWLADPRILPGNGWRESTGLAYALSEGGLPDLTGVWPSSDPGPARAVGDALSLALSHRTVQLGTLLAPYAVRYIVVVGALAPVIPGFQAPVEYPAPPGALAGLEAQPELSEVLAQGGFSVFVDDLALPEWASHPLP